MGDGLGLTLYKRGGVDGQLETEMFLLLSAGVLVGVVTTIWWFLVVCLFVILCAIACWCCGCCAADRR
jgi:hypothetical protein